MPAGLCTEPAGFTATPDPDFFFAEYRIRKHKPTEKTIYPKSGFFWHIICT